MTKIHPCADQITAHVEKYVGASQLLWCAEQNGGPLEIWAVPASEKRRFHFVWTRGMSAAPMNAPDPQWRHAELCMLLPPEWPLGETTEQNEASFWPIRLLGQLAALPFERDTWLGMGHTVPNGEPPQPYTNDFAMCAALLLPPLELERSFARVRLSDGEILNFWNVVPLHADELRFKIGNGLTPLLQAFEKRGVSDILNPTRQSVLVGRSGFKGWMR